jgi:hypothetical protein
MCFAPVSKAEVAFPFRSGKISIDKVKAHSLQSNSYQDSARASLTVFHDPPTADDGILDSLCRAPTSGALSPFQDQGQQLVSELWPVAKWKSGQTLPFNALCHNFVYMQPKCGKRN